MILRIFFVIMRRKHYVLVEKSAVKWNKIKLILTMLKVLSNFQTCNSIELIFDCCLNLCKMEENIKKFRARQKLLQSKKKSVILLTILSTISNGWYDLDGSSRFHLIPNTILMFRSECRVEFPWVCCVSIEQRFRCMCTMVDNSLRPSNLHPHR